MGLVPGYQFRPQVLPTLFCLGIVGLFGSLGSWQIRRLAESEARLSEFLEHISEAPLDAAVAPPDFADRRVEITGTPRWDRVMLVMGKYMFGQPGMQVIVPVVSKETSVLVFVGWIPQDEGEMVLKNEMAIPGERHYSGLARTFPVPAERHWSFPAEMGYQKRWGELDPLAMAKEAGVPARDWLLVDGEPSMGDDDISDRVPPISGWRATLYAPPHLNYAITWCSLAALVSVLWFTISFRKQQDSNAG